MQQDWFILMKRTLIKVPYYLERILGTQFKKYRCLSKPWRELRGFQLSVFHLNIAQSGKLGVGKPLSLIKVLLRKLCGFQLWVFGFGYSAKWKLGWKDIGKLILQGF